MSNSDEETKTILENWYSERQPDEKAEAAVQMGQLLPDKEKEGAPDGNLYLMEFADVTVKKSESDKNPGWPFVNTRLKVVEPDDFENRGFFTMFWLPRAHEGMEEKEVKAMARDTDALFYRIDTILGEGTAVDLFGEVHDIETATDGMERLADMLDEETAVVCVRIATPSKKQQDQGYKDKRNAVKSYANASEWEGEAF